MVASTGETGEGETGPGAAARFSRGGGARFGGLGGLGAVVADLRALADGLRDDAPRAVRASGDAFTVAMAVDGARYDLARRDHRQALRALMLGLGCASRATFGRRAWGDDRDAPPSAWEAIPEIARREAQSPSAAGPSAAEVVAALRRRPSAVTTAPALRAGLATLRHDASGSGLAVLGGAGLIIVGLLLTARPVDPAALSLPTARHMVSLR